MKRVETLYRVSTKGQVEKDDIPMQRTKCRGFVAMHDDWQIVREVCEKGISGFKVSSRKRGTIQSVKADAVNRSPFNPGIFSNGRLLRCLRHSGLTAIPWML